MSIYLCPLVVFEEKGDTSRVVIVVVGKDESIYTAWVYIQETGILHEQVALARIEEEIMTG